MVKINQDNEICFSKLRVIVRLDFKGVYKPGRLFFGGKDAEEIAIETRDQKTTALKNIPIQGIKLEDIDNSLDVYIVQDEDGNETAYAPTLITLEVDSLEDLVRFVIREEYRKMEILAPDRMVVDKSEIERVFFKINETIVALKDNLERKYANK